MYHKVLLFLLLVVFLQHRTTSTELFGANISVDDQKNASYIWRYGGPYGHYCGIFHTDRMFIKPINAVDRACQLHDTCISASGRYLECFCNEQLLIRMYDTCAYDTDAAYYRDQIIRAMNIGTSMCSSECALMDTYKISPELGFNAIPFYGPGRVQLREMHETVLIGLINKEYLHQFSEDNLIGRLERHLGGFKKLIEEIIIDIPVDEILFVLGEPQKKSATYFYGRVFGQE